MRWLLGGRRLRELGILGMNRRNASYILDHNPRSLFPLVDDKVRMHRLCLEIGVPTPALYGVMTAHSQLKNIPALLEPLRDFVIKPNRGSAGRGVLVVKDKSKSECIRHNGDHLSLGTLRHHCSDILSGMYSLGGQPDQILIQQRVRLHPAFEAVSWQGIPDIRIILYRTKPCMAMLRLPTRESNGRANLHQGGLGVGIDLVSGRTNHAVQRNRSIHRHPDTHEDVTGLLIPYWEEILKQSERIARTVGLGYLGVDIVIDGILGPLLLEANARPGLAIQIANAAGLIPQLERIDRELSRDMPEILNTPNEMPVAA